MAKAIIAGASGLIGGLLLDILLQSSEYKDIVILVRKELPIAHQKLKQLVVDFDKLEDYAAEINGQAIFCCLGTTRKKTPDQAVYRKIDHDYPVQMAKIGLQNGIKQYHLVSALGADAGSSTFYMKTKGEVEEDITKVGLKCLHIYRPSFLTGERTEKNRVEEKIVTLLFKVIDPLLMGGLKKYRSIPAKTVAMAMYKQSLKQQEGVFIHLSDQIKQIA
ncbi:NAD(P)H-binding protein [uncultured Mucilaginibacter sp.]|uniref:NAD(P)H-binding protein n=1 Tax=uncultured Mucilaginibacter sp. TaxID=797541 RepID=UPI0025F91BA3|nr:NAD(P)H-binding protein [uncultured Mucilaginibacter sp.]